MNPTTSGGPVVDMARVPFTPTEEELAKVAELKQKLNDTLEQNGRLSKPVQVALSNFVKDEGFLLKFIIGRKGNVERALETVIRYAEIRFDESPELFPQHVPEFLHTILDDGILTHVRNRDHLGRIVCVFRYGKWDPSKVSLEQLLCVTCYICDALMTLPEALVHGTVVIHDLKGVSWGHAKQFSVNAIRRFIQVLLRGYPTPLKGLYLVNTPVLAKPIYPLAKPFLPKKLQERVLLASGTDELHQRISSTILPEYLGGPHSEKEIMSTDILTATGILGVTKE